MSTVASTVPRVNGAAVATAALLFAALVLLLDGPVWLVNLVPTQDGPVHLAQSDLIARFGWGGALAEPAASFYQWNPRIEPNFAIYAVIAGLIRLTGDALLANSIFLTLYGLVWVMAAFAIAHTESKRPTLAVLLLLPLAFGRFIHLGFYNYALGVPLFLLFAVFRRRRAGRHDAGALIATVVFLLALCMTHVTAAVVACLLLAAEGLTRAAAALQRSGPRVAARTFVIDGAWALAAALPTLLLVGSFLIAYRDIPGELPGRLQLIPRLVGASYLFSFTWWEVVALAPLLGAVVIAGIATLRRVRSLDLLWPVFLILVLALSALNLGTGMASLSERLAPFTWIALVLMIARAPLNAALVRALGVAALIGLAGQTAIRAIAYKSWAPALDTSTPQAAAIPAQLSSMSTSRCWKTPASPGAWPDAPRQPDGRPGRAWRWTVLGAAVEALFRLLPAAICGSQRFHARDAGLVDRAGCAVAVVLPQRQSRRAAGLDRDGARRRRIKSREYDRFRRLQEEPYRRAMARGLHAAEPLRPRHEHVRSR